MKKFFSTFLFASFLGSIVCSNGTFAHKVATIDLNINFNNLNKDKTNHRKESGMFKSLKEDDVPAKKTEKTKYLYLDNEKKDEVNENHQYVRYRAGEEKTNEKCKCVKYKASKGNTNVDQSNSSSKVKATVRQDFANTKNGRCGTLNGIAYVLEKLKRSFLDAPFYAGSLAIPFMITIKVDNSNILKPLGDKFGSNNVIIATFMAISGAISSVIHWFL